MLTIFSCAFSLHFPLSSLMLCSPWVPLHGHHPAGEDGAGIWNYRCLGAGLAKCSEIGWAEALRALLHRHSAFSPCWVSSSPEGQLKGPGPLVVISHLVVLSNHPGSPLGFLRTEGGLYGSQNNEGLPIDFFCYA